MTYLPEKNGAAIVCQSATLMARIVDAAGRCVERADIASIRYSIMEIGAGDVDEAAVVPGHDQVPLEVNAVIHDWLECDGLWTVDSEGYNFRHELVIEPTPTIPKPHTLYQAIYELVSAAGQTAVVRFMLRIS